MTNEFFLHRVSDTEAARVPFPLDVALEDREAYMANPPAEAVEKAVRIPFNWLNDGSHETAPWPSDPAPTPTPTPVAPVADALDDEGEG